MLGVPKYNEDTHVEQVLPPPLPPRNIPSRSGRRKSEGKFVTKKSNVKLLKLPESECTKIRPGSEPFCVFCNSVQKYRNKRLEQRPNDVSCYTRCNPVYEKLIRGHCTDTKQLLGIPNIDLLNPAEALFIDSTLSVLKDFVDHFSVN